MASTEPDELLGPMGGVTLVFIGLTLMLEGRLATGAAVGAVLGALFLLALAATDAPALETRTAAIAATTLVALLVGLALWLRL